MVALPIQSQSAAPFGQSLLNQAGGFRQTRIRDLIQKKEQIFGEIDRLRKEREIKKQQEAESGLSGSQIGALAGPILLAPFTGGASLATLGAIGASSAIGSGVGSFFDEGAGASSGIQSIRSGAQFFEDEENDFIFKTPQLSNN